MAKDIGNVDQLRRRIDSGGTGEKVDYPDPATVPLGTDAEAGGTPPTKAEVRLDASASQPAPKRRNNRDPGIMLYAALALPVMAAFLLVVRFAG